ncbi:unnamed protein product [Gadus morhua 'NCC']
MLQSVVPLRAEQLLLLRLRTTASEQKNFKKKVVRLPTSRLLTQAQEDIVESTATSPPTSHSCSSTPGTSSTTPDTPSKRRVPGSRRGMRRARQSWRNGGEHRILERMTHHVTVQMYDIGQMLLQV